MLEMGRGLTVCHGGCRSYHFCRYDYASLSLCNCVCHCKHEEVCKHEKFELINILLLLKFDRVVKHAMGLSG